MDKIYIKSLVQEVLNREFTSTERRRITEDSSSVVMCCPICGDSKDERKKRGHLYLDTLKYVCYNEGCNSNLDQLCKKYKVQIDPAKKMEIIQHLNEQVTYDSYEDNLLDARFNELLDINDLVASFGNNDHGITDFKPVVVGGIVDSYLLRRGITEDLRGNIWQAKSWISEERYENVICLLNKGGNKILSMQMRNLREGKNRMFKIYDYGSLYSWINGEDSLENMDMEKIALYNKLGHYFNIMNVDFTKTVTIFEGYLESLFYPNAIGVIGTNTDMRFLESNNLPLQYLYDNDFAGYKKTEEKIKSGFNVFLWKKLFEDITFKKRESDPYKLMHRISSVKDLNALAVLVKNPFKTLQLNEYFSKDVFDIKYVPKLKFQRKV
jgi:hypothetical protein